MSQAGEQKAFPPERQMVGLNIGHTVEGNFAILEMIDAAGKPCGHLIADPAAVAGLISRLMTVHALLTASKQ